MLERKEQADYPTGHIIWCTHSSTYSVSFPIISWVSTFFFPFIKQSLMLFVCQDGEHGSPGVTDTTAPLHRESRRSTLVCDCVFYSYPTHTGPEIAATGGWIMTYFGSLSAAPVLSQRGHIRLYITEKLLCIPVPLLKLERPAFTLAQTLKRCQLYPQS